MFYLFGIVTVAILREVTRRAANESFCREVREGRYVVSSDPVCTDCGGRDLKRNGTYKGKETYACRGCGRYSRGVPKPPDDGRPTCRFCGNRVKVAKRFPPRRTLWRCLTCGRGFLDVDCRRVARQGGRRARTGCRRCEPRCPRPRKTIRVHGGAAKSATRCFRFCRRSHRAIYGKRPPRTMRTPCKPCSKPGQTRTPDRKSVV